MNEYVLIKYHNWKMENPQIDMLTIMILNQLILDVDRLFGKYMSLENTECYQLCNIFKNLLQYVGLNVDYIEWRKSAKNCN